VATPFPQAVAPTVVPPGFHLLNRLNQPLVTGLPPRPGLPTASPLGLIAPRVSFFTTFVTSGGFGNMPANLAPLIGFASPRGAPIITLLRDWPPSTQDGITSGLNILSPRALVGARILRGYVQSGPAGGGLFGPRYR
jgi:hypothetical protein